MIIPALALLLLAAAPQPVLRKELAPMQFLAGHCWRATFADKAVDTHCFAPVYAGQHLRDTHEVRGPKGIYRGETLYSWDRTAGGVRYTYWNSLGGVMHGGMSAEAGALRFTPDGASEPILWRRAGVSGYDVIAGGATLRFRKVR